MAWKFTAEVRPYFLMAAVIFLGVFCAILPFLPGSHFDGVHMLATITHVAGALGFVLVPAGIIWLVVAVRRKGGKQGSLLPLYLILVPGTLLAVQLALAAPLTDWSRKQAIQNTTEIIRDLEAFKEQHGRYPESLLALWPDYSTGVVGVSQYFYEPQGQSYNLVFEQPRFLLDGPGTRELVVYNPQDEQRAVSHAAWRLSSPEAQGWYAVRDTTAPHWKSFLFD